MGSCCGKREAHAKCTLCHHYFHDNPKFLPAGEEKLIAIPTGKRDRDGNPVLGELVMNTCFHVWHADGRAKAWGNTPAGFVPRTVVAQPGVSSISSLSGNDDSTNSQVDIADSVAAEYIAALESGGESTLLDALENASGPDADAMESDGDESGDGDGNDAPLIEL